MLSRRPAILLLAVILDLITAAAAAASSFSSATPQDPCEEGGHAILDDWRRTPLYQPRSPRDVLCDRHLRPAWYRFTLHNRSAEIPTQCAAVNYCGTQAPLWLHLNGRSLPESYAEENLTVCASWSLLDSQGNDDHCCAIQYPVVVRNCSRFLIYFLHPTPGCNMAYCAQLAAETLPFNFDGVPAIRSHVDQRKQVFLNCSVRYSSTSGSSTQFRFSWFKISAKDSTQTLLRSHVTTSPSGSSSISGSVADLLPRSLLSVGDQIICGVEALLGIQSNHLDVVNPSVTSLPFKAGITISPTQLILHKNGTVQNVTVTVTVPFLCGTHVKSHDCHFNLNIDQKSSNQIQKIAVSHCHLDLDKVGMEQDGYAQFNISFAAVNDYIRTEDPVVDVQMILSSYGDSWWHGYAVPNITAQIVDIQPVQCYAFTMGHIVTIDSSMKRIDSGGNYLLYHNPSQQLTVSAEFQDCAGEKSNSFCACAVQVKYFQEEFTINHCRNEILQEDLQNLIPANKESLPKISLKSKDFNKKLKVWESRQGKLLTVVMETGSRVRVRIEPWGLSISIVDGTLSEDLKSIVSGLCTENLESLGSSPIIEEKNLCFCNPSKEQNCDPEFEFCSPVCQKWSPARWIPFFNFIDITDEALVWTKDSDSEEVFNDKRLRRHESEAAVYSSSMGRDIFWTVRSKRAAENIKDDDIFFYCSNYLVNSTIAVECGQYLNAAIMKAIEICMEDVTVNADVRWATYSLGLLEDQCEVEAVYQQNQWPRDLLNQPTVPKSIIEALNCPNRCSGHGVCLDLGCVCQPGFWSLDCSIIDERPPKLSISGLDNFCDSTSRNCSTIPVSGSTFIDSSHLTCRYWFGRVLQDYTWLRDNQTFRSQGIFQDPYSVGCPLEMNFDDLQEEVYVEVQVSNDGTAFSESAFVTVFNARCRTCSYEHHKTALPICFDREDICILDNHCFLHNDVNPKNSCQICLVNQSEHWSINQGNKAPIVSLSDIKIVVYDGQDLVYQLPVVDEDSDNLTFSLVDPVTDVKIDSSGYFHWKAVSNSLSVINHEVFYISISDNCNPPIEVRLEIEVFPCPCGNGGSCTSHSQNGPDSNLIPTYTCLCPAGFTGKDCNMRIDPCFPNPCVHGTCYPTSTSPTCRCSLGYQGEFCDKLQEPTQLIDVEVQVLPVMEHNEDSAGIWNVSNGEVSSDFESEWNSLPGFCAHPCQNGGVCVFPGTCKCPTGFRGSRCQVKDCFPGCQNGGRCLKRNRCKCREGFRGPRCELQVVPTCYPPCQNSAKCLGNNTCSCRKGWTGDVCNTPVCDPPCLNRGICWKPGKCACPHGYRGSKCSKPICSPKCQHGGKCIAPGICKCKTAFAGSLCEIPLKKSRRKTGRAGSRGPPRGSISSSISISSSGVREVNSGGRPLASIGYHWGAAFLDALHQSLSNYSTKIVS